MREALAGGAACKAARPAWGSVRLNGARHLCLEWWNKQEDNTI